MLKNKNLLAMSFAFVLLACGSDTRELTADEPVLPRADTSDTYVGPDPAMTSVLEAVPELNNGFHTRDFDRDSSRYVTLDSHFVRLNKMVTAGYVFEPSETWQAVGKMVTGNYILLFVNYRNTGTNNIDLYVFNLEGQPLSGMPLSIGTAPEGQAPVEGTVNPEGLVTVTYRDRNNLVRKDFEITGDNGEFRLVKSVQLPK